MTTFLKKGARLEVLDKIEIWARMLRELAQQHRDAAFECDKRAKWVEDKSFRYRVELHSLWADEGELDVSITGEERESLKKVTNRAETEFKKVNERSDVQARRAVYLVFPDDSEYMVKHGFEV